MLARHTGFRPFPLRGDQGDAPLWAPGTTIQFDMDNIPMNDGNKANYVPVLALTCFGRLTQTTAGTGPITQEVLLRNLVQSVEIQGAFHGRPLSANHVRGAVLPIIERIGCGYQSPARRMRPLVNDAVEQALQAFRFTTYLPLAHLLGENPHYTSQLALLFRDAQFIINTGPVAAVVAASTDYGNAWTFDTAGAGAVTFQCSAMLLPEKSIRLAPATEWIEFQQTASANSETVDLTSLGNTTSLEGVEPGAGVDTMLALCDVRGQLGSFVLDTLTRFSAPLRGITQTRHLDPFMQMLEQASTEHGRPLEGTLTDVTGAIIGNLNDFSSFPYTRDGIGPGAEVSDETVLDPTGLCFPIIVASPQLQTSKLLVFEGTQTYYRTLSDAPTQQKDRTLCHQYKSWTPQKISEFRDLIISSKLAEKVLGTNDIEVKAALDGPTDGINLSKGRFFPIEYVARDTKKAA